MEENKMDERKRQPDFICDPVPENYRRRYEERKGKYRNLAVAAVVLFIFGIEALDALLSTGWGLAEGVLGFRGWSRGTLFLWALLKGMLRSALFVLLPLYVVCKWHASLTGKAYAAKIREYEAGWFSGFFTAECLITENREDQRKCWYYSEISLVEEDGGAFRIQSGSGALTILKMYLKRDSVRSIRNHLQRYCSGVYRQEFVEEEENISLVLSGRNTLSAPGKSSQGNPQEDAREQKEIREGYLRYVRDSMPFYYMETRIWIGGICAYYLIRCAFSESRQLSLMAILGIALIIIGIPVLRQVRLLSGRRAVKARERQINAGFPSVLEIGRSGVLFRSGGEIWQPWEKIRKITEGRDCFVIGRIYLPKGNLTEEENGQVRALCQKYAGRKYSFEEERPQKMREIMRTFLPILCFAIFTAVVAIGENRLEWWNDRSAESGTWAESGQAETDTTEAERQEDTQRNAGAGDQGSREPVYVTTPDKAALHLTAEEIQIDNCYSHNEANYASRFFIDSYGTLYGASANEHGELGNGTTEPDITAKGFYRETEVARNVCHVSLGEEFMVYLTDSGVLMGTGKLPTEDSPGFTTAALELMSDVRYVKCSDYGMIVLKEDGTVWCAGRLCDRAGNVIREYSGFEQVMDHAVYADAGRRTMAVIRSDGSLWMWGDNSSQQCGVDSRVEEEFREPVQVKGNVRMVWLDRLSFSSEQEYQGYLENVSDPEDQYSYNVFWTYILLDDGQLYACGRDGTFVEVTVIEE